MQNKDTRILKRINTMKEHLTSRNYTHFTIHNTETEYILKGKKLTQDEYRNIITMVQEIYISKETTKITKTNTHSYIINTLNPQVKRER